MSTTATQVPTRKVSSAVAMLRIVQEAIEDNNIAEQERAILSLFYDERLKVRKTDVPLFYIYSQFCERTDITEWAVMMAEINLSISKLEKYDYIVKRQYDAAVNPSNYVGSAAELYGLSAKGLEKLTQIKPPLALRLRAWVAVMPPWVTMTGTIAGGIAAIWKIIDWSRTAAIPFLHAHHIWHF